MTETNDHAETAISHLSRADGSATFSQGGYSIIAAVNGPVEALRRDELPEEAVVDVMLRPASGAGGPRERHIEMLLQSTLRQIILVHNHPRMLLQIVLQVAAAPDEDSSSSGLSQSRSVLPILPALLQASVLALLSASVPLATTCTAVLVAPMPQGSYILDPSSKQCEEASSAHVLAFTSQGALLLAESEGDFDLDQWEEVFDRAKSACCGPSNAKGDEDALMEDESPDPMPRQQMLRDVMRAKVARDQSWKESLQHVAVDG